MASPKHISDRFPRTGEQTQKTSFENELPQGMLEGDKLIYQLVARNVDFCGEQFGDNLKYNSEVLTDVLYDNIYQLLGEKFQGDDFVNWLVDELIKQGFVFKNNQESENTVPKQNESKQTEQEPVFELDDSAYEELKQKVYAAIELIKANKLTIFKLLSDVDNDVKSIGDQRIDNIVVHQEMMSKQDEKIRYLVKRIKGSVPSVQEYITNKKESDSERKKESGNTDNELIQTLDSSITTRKKGLDESTTIKNDIVKMVEGIFSKLNGLEQQKAKPVKDQRTKGSIGVTPISLSINPQMNGKNVKTKNNLRGNFLNKLTDLKDKQEQIDASTTIEWIIDYAMTGKSVGKQKQKNKLAIPHMRAKQSLKQKRKKPSIMSRVSKSLTNKVKSVGRSIKTSISRSFVGKMWRGVKKVGRGIAKTAKFAAKATVFAAKASIVAAKAFVKASRLVGKAVVKGGIALVKGVRSLFNRKRKPADKPKTKNEAKKMGKSQNAVFRVLNSSGAAVVTKFALKLGWSAIKFVGKVLWNIVKKVGGALFGAVGKLFSFIGKFVNTVSYYSNRIGRGIKNKAYRFLVKPIANILVTVFAFTMAVLKVPINFMKQLLPQVFNRILAVMSNIRKTVRWVYKATWGIFKRILFNPITIGLIIGGLCLFVIPKIIGMVQQGASAFKGIFTSVMSFVSNIWDTLKSIGQVIYTIASTIFRFVAWLTAPSSWFTKFAVLLVKGILQVKKFIAWLIGKSGRDSVDTLCMWLAGDYIGLALRAAIGGIKKLWKWLRGFKFFRIVGAIVKSLLKFQELLLTWPYKLAKGIYKWAKNFILGKKASLKDLFKPFIDWWKSVSQIWKSGDIGSDVITEDLDEKMEQQSNDIKTEREKLNMKGMSGGKMLNKLDEVRKSTNNETATNILDKIIGLYQQNAGYIGDYQKFLNEVWEFGHGNTETEMQAIKALLESPELSQKLLSGFFYYHPHDGSLRTTMPPRFINQFLDKLRNLVVSDQPVSDKFKKIIKTFEQINKERQAIVVQQGDIIYGLMQDITQAGKAEGPDATKKFDNLQKRLNSDLFEGISVKKGFKSLAHGAALTRQQSSITGDDEELDTSELLTGFTGVGGGKLRTKNIKRDDFMIKEQKPDESQDERIKDGDIYLPDTMTAPKPPPITSGGVKQTEDSLRENYYKFLRDRQQQFIDGKMKNDSDSEEYKYLTFDEYKMKHLDKVPIEKQQEMDEVAKREMRIRSDIDAYRKQGEDVNVEGFRLGAQPTILNLSSPNLTQHVIMWSPQWFDIYGASKLSDVEIEAKVLQQMGVESEKLAQLEQQKQQQEQEEKRQRQREQEILDYSVKIKDGYIEIKMGEDVTAMQEAWWAHNHKRKEAFKRNLTPEQVDAMGLQYYSWEEWQKHYRKINGMPEDGIKRIKFEGKKKDRKVELSVRSPVTYDELSKYGVTVSQDGPVMIPMDQALSVTNQLLQQAETIYSIRDGLEVLRYGLVYETKKLAKRREDGYPVVVSENKQEQNETTDPYMSPDTSKEKNPEQ